MLALLFGLVLAPSPADSTDNLDTCLSLAPVQSEPPVTWEDDLHEMWTDEPLVPPDSVKAYLSQVREARACLLHLDPSEVTRPYLGNIMRTFYVETALLASLRRFSEAHATFEEARSFLDDRPPIPSTEAGRTYWPPVLHQNQAYLHYLLGNLSASIGHYLKAYETTPDTEPSRRVQFLLDIGILHQRAQSYRSAREYFERAKRLFSESSLSAQSHPIQKARVLSVRADLLLERTLNADFDPDALKRVQRMARKSRALSVPGTERRARTSNVLSETLSYLGDYKAAYSLNREVRQYALENDVARLHVLSLLKLGVIHVQTERWPQADSVLQEALSRAKALGDLDYQRRILRALGRLHEMQSRWAEAEQFYRRGVTVIEEYRESLTASQWSMTAFAQWRDTHRGLVRTLLAQNRPRAALTALDRSRARHLQDLRTQNRVATQLPAAARARLDSLSRALANVRSKLGAKTLSEAQTSRLRTRETALMSARQALLQIDSSATARPTIETVSTRLAAQDRALVSYFLDDPWPIYGRTPRSAAFVLTPDTLRTVPLPGLSQDSVRALTRSTSSLFAARNEPEPIGAMHFDLQPLRRLYDQLYAPIKGYLAPGEPLTVIPDGPLFHLPFSILVSATPGGRYDHHQARYVLHERPTTLELATSMAGDTTTTAFDPSTIAPDVAAFGVSTFDSLRTLPSALRATLPEAATEPPFTLPPLPGVRSEMMVLRDLLGDVQAFLDSDATEPAFARACRRAGVLHLASHAFVHPSSPLQNAFLLHPDSTSDGILFLHELQAQDRLLPLAVLSGCSTARGTLRGGEGMAGLQYAFRAMGAQATVANLWPSADRPSVTLMKSFYQHLQDGLPKDRALRQAKLAYLEAHPEKASPFFWAPAVLYGSPQPVPLEEAPSWFGSWPWWLSVLLALLVLLGGVALWRSPRGSEAYQRFFSA